MIIPAFDFIKNKILRLYQGNYTKKTYYDVNLYDCLTDYQNQGIKIVHLVDLDGAKNRKNRQLDFFKKILSYNLVSIQMGGGIRTENDVYTLLSLGVKRVVIGSAAIEKKYEVVQWLKRYGPDSIVLALDVRINKKNDKEISIHGWKDKTGIKLEEIIKYFSDFDLKHVLCTDISRDGTLFGPNIELYTDLVKNFKNICFQASGGVGNIQDILLLKKSGVKNIIIGRSLLENKFTVQEALKCWQNA